MVRERSRAPPAENLNARLGIDSLYVEWTDIDAECELLVGAKHCTRKIETIQER